MSDRPNTKRAGNIFIYGIILIIILAIITSGEDSTANKIESKISNKVKESKTSYSSKEFSIISSSENKDLDSVLKEYAAKENIPINIEYAGTLEIMEKLNSGEKYDAVWAANSIWLYMLDSNVVSTSNSKSISINPVVFGITKSKAQSLGFIGKEIYTQDIVDAIRRGDLKFSMSNPTQTNTGATAYLGILSTIAGNPEVLRDSDIENPEVKENLVTTFSGLERSSGDEDFLEEMFLNGNYEAVVTYESSIIAMNQKLSAQGKEPLYVLYPVDGVSISDSPFAYINNKDDNKKEQFDKIQGYLLSEKGQEKLASYGRRTWFGGINENADKKVFNPDWGIDTTKYIVPVKYPSTSVIKKALGLYQTEFRKPIYTVFCLDFSGSMAGEGHRELTKAINYILTEEEASRDLLQFTEKDKIAIIPFSSDVKGTYVADNGANTDSLKREVEKLSPYGGTNIFDTCTAAIKLVKDVDLNEYNVSIILMTDGMSNQGSESRFKSEYTSHGRNVPIYSIMFGDAYEDELEDIAEYTNAKVFNGKTDLLKAFKEVRGYN